MNIEKIWDDIKNFFSSMPKRLIPFESAALKFTTELKAALSSTEAILITSIIPGDLDEEIRTKLISILGQVIPLLSVSQTCGGDLDCWAKSLAALPTDVQDALLIKFAQKIVAYLDDNKLKQNKYDSYTQIHFSTTIAQ